METNLRARLDIEIVKAMSLWSTREVVWGTDDCMIAVADIVKTVTGKDPAQSIRGRYKTKLGAYRVLGSGGIKKQAYDAAKRMGWRRIRADDAQVGDVGLVGILVVRRGKKHVSFAAAICRAKGWFISRGERRFVAIPSRQIVHAWCVDA